MNKEINEKWLVKSSDTIIGPLEFDQVVENIFKGDIHLLDEIKGPFERWRPIKDHSLFAAAIEKLKASTYARSEYTMTATIDIATQTNDVTTSPTQPVDDEITASGVGRRGEDDELLKAVYQTPGRASKASSAFAFSFLFLLLGGAAYLIYQYQNAKESEQKVSAYDELTDVGIRSLQVGDYQLALKSLNGAYNIRGNDNNLIMELAPLSVQFEGRFSQVQTMMEALLASEHNKDILKRANTVAGLTYSYRAQWDEALNSYQKALNIEPNYFPALFNLSYVHLKKANFLQAVQQMKDVVSANQDEALAHYLYIRALVEMGVSSKDKKWLKEALSVSNHYVQKFADLKQEVLFLVAWAHFALGEEVESHVAGFLKVDFELTQLHVHDILTDFQSFNWVDFMAPCKQLGSKLSGYSALRLQAFCDLKLNKTIEAKKNLEDLLAQNNRDGMLQSLYASTLFKLDDISKAKNALGLLNQVDPNQPVVETIIRGCLLAQDISCVDTIFKGSYMNLISLLYSHWGNSELNFGKDNRKSQSSVDLGLSISPHFAPLLRLKMRLEQAKGK